MFSGKQSKLTLSCYLKIQFFPKPKEFFREKRIANDDEFNKISCELVIKLTGVNFYDEEIEKGLALSQQQVLRSQEDYVDISPPPLLFLVCIVI